ncbi:MAG: protease-like activity factor CPAF [Parachlamydiales bacterium]|nr:protease-like activity factor CPAF [Parachlamydiales bacterium]
MLSFFKNRPKFLSYFFCFSFLTLFGSVESDKLRMKNDLFFIKEIFNGHYAPKQWKESFANWNLDAEIQNVEAQISQKNLTIKQFQKVLKDFTLSVKDYHVGIYFYSTEEAHLPFYVKSANGRYFISYVKKWAPEDFPFHEGDEILTFGGKPIDKVVQTLKKELLGDNVSLADQGLAEIYLTNRSGKTGADVPKGSITITGKDGYYGYPLFSTLQWDYSAEKVNDPQAHISKQPVLAGMCDCEFNPPFINLSLLNKDMSAPFSTIFQDLCKKDMRNPHAVGAKISMLPPLGNILWSTDPEDPFEAYIFETASKKLIGFIRIPHYSFGEEEAKEFGMLMDFFENGTEGLIIDQQNNYGGLVLFGYGVMSMLTDRPLVLPKHRMMLRQEEVYNAYDMIEKFSFIKSNWQARKFFGETWFGYPINLKFVESLIGYCQFMIDEWDQGKHLSDPGYLYLDAVDPHPKTRYTKPLLIVINPLDFSCGDFLPATMQDNKRAKLIGTRTAGAGGYIDFATFPNYSGISKLRYTASIAERMDKTPIENLGVKPDIVYNITVSDLQNNFEPYAKFIVDEMEKIIDKK